MSLKFDDRFNFHFTQFEILSLNTDDEYIRLKDGFYGCIVY